LLWNFNWICNCWYCNWCGKKLNYSWKKCFSTEVGTTASISNLPAGTYAVTVTDNCSSKSNSVTMGQPAAALVELLLKLMLLALELQLDL
jgi:hypothetical protein